ncbi:hypothetical protein [Runella sp.]|uniref:hypothetical protein n=1 Tax=Runella sp. TaxID=1960881 RepID=UPI00301B01A3
MSQEAGLRCFILKPVQTYIWNDVYTNIGHAQYLSGNEAEAQTAWFHLKGQKDASDKDYKQVLEEDWQNLEKSGVVALKAFDKARVWLAGAW